MKTRRLAPFRIARKSKGCIIPISFFTDPFMYEVKTLINGIFMLYKHPIAKLMRTSLLSASFIRCSKGRKIPKRRNAFFMKRKTHTQKAVALISKRCMEQYLACTANAYLDVNLHLQSQILFEPIKLDGFMF